MSEVGGEKIQTAETERRVRDLSHTRFLSLSLSRHLLRPSEHFSLFSREPLEFSHTHPGSICAACFCCPFHLSLRSRHRNREESDITGMDSKQLTPPPGAKENDSLDTLTQALSKISVTGSQDKQEHVQETEDQLKMEAPEHLEQVHHQVPGHPMLCLL